SRPGVRLAHDALPDVVQPDVGGHVDAHAALLDGVEVAGQAVPFDALAAGGGAARAELALERAGRPALAEHLGGDALANLALGVAVLQKEIIGVRVHVDEPGRDHQPPGVDGAAGSNIRHPADGDDAVAADADVAVKPRVAGAVHDPAVADE